MKLFREIAFVAGVFSIASGTLAGSTDDGIGSVKAGIELLKCDLLESQDTMYAPKTVAAYGSEKLNPGFAKFTLPKVLEPNSVGFTDLISEATWKISDDREEVELTFPLSTNVTYEMTIFLEKTGPYRAVLKHSKDENFSTLFYICIAKKPKFFSQSN